MRPPGTRSRKFNYLRAYDCKYRESLARLKKSKILTICLENPFREIYSKKIFRSLKNQMCPRKWRKTKTRVFTFLQPSSAVSADFLFYSFISFPYQRVFLTIFNYLVYFIALKYDFYNWFASCKFLTLATVRCKLFNFLGTFLNYPDFLFHIVLV